MTYIFSGIFTRQNLLHPRLKDSEELVVRSIEHTQIKAGALFAKDQVSRPSQVTFDLIQRVKGIGVTDGLWMYYSCWAGTLDCIATARFSDSHIDINSYSISDDLMYLDLYKVFKGHDIEIESSGYFEPFVRNYWGEYGY